MFLLKENMKLDKFFSPKSIAIIGASNHTEKVGGILMKKALKSKCEIIPINPSHLEIFGVKCYKDINNYNGDIDLAVIAIPKDFVYQSIEEIGKKGIKNVIIVSAGFSEVGNNKDEKKIVEIAKKYGIKFIGPNCFGICNAYVNLDLTFAMETPKKGNIAFVSQSGALWSYLADLDYGFSGYVGLGNMADLEFCDFVEHFSNDENTKSIILYIEKLKNGKEFIETCKNAVEKGKKIYAVKAGKSEAGEKATFSHTASLASDYEIYKGAFKQAGIILCSTIEEALFMASGKKIWLENKNTNNKIKFDKEVYIITNAGGAGALMSDYLYEKGIKIIADKDIIGTALSENYLAALEEAGKQTNNILVVLTCQSMSDVNETAQVIADFKNKTGKNVAALFLGDKSVRVANDIFKNNDVVYFNNFSDAGAGIF